MVRSLCLLRVLSEEVDHVSAAPTLCVLLLRVNPAIG